MDLFFLVIKKSTKNPTNTAVAVRAVSGLSIAMVVATNKYAEINMIGINGKNFIE